MTIPNFVNLLLRSGGVIQFREPDKITIDYTGRTLNKESFVTKMVWEGPMHHVSSEDKMEYEDAVKEIIDRVAKKTK